MSSGETLADVEPGNAEWDALSTFFGAYLNQDFVDEYGGTWETVEEFARLETSSYVGRTADQVNRLLARSSTDHETERALERVGMGYRPSADGWATREWLAELERRLRALVDRQR